MKTRKGGLTRRKFLEAAGTIGAATVVAACDSEETAVGASPGSRTDDAGGGRDASASGGRDAGAGRGQDSGATPRADAGPQSTTDAHIAGPTVAIVKDSDIDSAVAQAISLAGGIDAILPGQTVFIKPNAVSDRAIGTPGIRTNPAVLGAVVRLVKTRRPGRIIVGDRSARTFPDTNHIFTVSGLADAALAAGADEIFAAASPVDDPSQWVLLQPPHYEETWSAPGGILAMRKIVEADHLINVPACKDHHYAVISLSMKCFMGAIGDTSRDYVHLSNAPNFPRMGRDIALLNQMFKPLMNVIDATTALINGGPEGDGTNAVRTSPGLIFASKDRVALDAAGVSLIKLELTRTAVPMPDNANSTLRTVAPWSLPQIQNGGLLGLGAAAAAGVELRFRNASDAAAIEAIFRS